MLRKYIEHERSRYDALGETGYLKRVEEMRYKLRATLLPHHAIRKLKIKLRAADLLLCKLRIEKAERSG